MLAVVRRLGIFLKTAVTEAMGEDSRIYDLFEIGVSYARRVVASHKTEERRKV